MCSDRNNQPDYEKVKEETGASVEVLKNQVEKLQIEVTVKDLKNRRLQNELIISQKLLDIHDALMAKRAQVSLTPQPSNNFQSLSRERRRRLTSKDRERQNPHDPDTHGETSHQQKEYRE